MTSEISKNKYHYWDSPVLAKNLHQHDSANLSGQRPIKFCCPNDFFRSGNVFLKGLRGRQNKNFL